MKYIEYVAVALLKYDFYRLGRFATNLCYEHSGYKLMNYPTEIDKFITIENCDIPVIVLPIRGETYDNWSFTNCHV